jgi:glycosyltransferase involved in cell wall biosynthesis
MSCRGGDITIYPHVPRERWTERLPAAFARASAVHCVSEATKREAVQHGLDPSKATVIRTAVDSKFFHPNGRAPSGESELRIVTVGSLRWLKGYEYALQALARLRDVGIDAHLDVLGGDPVLELAEKGERERLVYTAADLGLHGRLHLLGESTEAKVRESIWRSHVMLHSSLVEGIPNAVLEAMACGRPVVATDCGGIREAIEDRVDGLIVPPRDAGAIANALERLWLDPVLRDGLVHAGRRRVQSEFSPERQLDGFLRLYQGVAGRSHRERARS